MVVDINYTPRQLYPRENPVPTVQQAGCGRLRKIPPLPGFDPRTVQPAASRYSD
jgi:hypothetical protein